MSDLTTVSVGQGWPDDRPGGLNRYVADLHAGLLEAGVDDRLVVFGPAASAGAGVHPAGDENATLANRLYTMSAEARRVGVHADLLATHFAMYASVPAQLPPLKRRPLVAHFHGPWAEESLAQGGSRAAARVKRAVERNHLRSARAVITDSTAFAELAVELHGLDRRRVHAIHPGVDLQRFHPLGEVDRMALRAKLEVAAGDLLVVTARRLVPRMGLEALLHAWPGAPDAQLVIIGDGPLRHALQQAAHDLPGVRVTGRVDDARLVAWYQAADVVVVPSLTLEGFGLVVLEALACGTPVLASDVGGMAEVLPQLDRSLLVPPGDGARWRARLADLPKGTLPSRGACRSFAEARSASTSAELVAEIYRHVASG